MKSNSISPTISIIVDKIGEDNSNVWIIEENNNYEIITDCSNIYSILDQLQLTIIPDITLMKEGISRIIDRDTGKFININKIENKSYSLIKVVKICRNINKINSLQVTMKTDFSNKEIRREIKNEIIKALCSSTPSTFIRNLMECNLLSIIMPCLVTTIGVNQNEYHCETVFDHLLNCVDAAVDLTDKPIVRLAALLHDIGKPNTLSIDKNNKVHFYKHEIVGATIAYKWMREFGFDKRDIDKVVKLIRYHQFRFHTKSKDKTIRKWLQKVLKDNWEDLIVLRYADRKGNLAKKDLPVITKEMKELISRIQRIINDGKPTFREDLSITYSDVKDFKIDLGQFNKQIIPNLLGLITVDPEKNNKTWLTNYVIKNYSAQVKDE